MQLPNQKPDFWQHRNKNTADRNGSSQMYGYNSNKVDTNRMIDLNSSKEGRLPINMHV